MVRAIIFDADGVLVKSERFSDRIARDHGASTAEVGRFFKNEFAECKLGRRDLKRELEKRGAAWGWRGSAEGLMRYWFAEEANPFDKHLLARISELRSKGIRCFLATNNEKYRTENLWSDRGLGKELDGMFSSAYMGVMKPDPDFFGEIADHLPGTAKEEILFVDGDKACVEAAENFGFRAYHYRDFEAFERELEELLKL